MSLLKPTVLVFGDVDGQFRLLIQKLKKLSQKLKNVTMVLCAGNFFGPNCDQEWEEVVNGSLKTPFQIFILGPSSKELKRFYPDCSKMADVADRITCLGKCGTFRTAEGIKLAYFSGTFSEETSELTYSYDDINKVVKDSIKDRPDFLITWSWPHDIGDSSENVLQAKHSERSSAYLFSALAPQYHITARERRFLELSVERFYEDGASAGISRFKGLSHLGESGVVNWVKALMITPFKSDQNAKDNTLKHMVPLQIVSIDNFLNINDRKRSSRNIEKSKSNKKRPERAYKVDDLQCWFCLANPEVEKHMIIAVGDYSFLALAKGPLIDEHVLISSIQHSPTMRLASEQTRDEIEKFKNVLRDMFGRFAFPVFYERAFRSSHLQVHCVPIPLEKSDNIVPSFMQVSTEYGLTIKEYKNEKRCYMSLLEDAEYFHLDISQGHELMISGNLEKRFPLNFGREALIVKSLLNKPSLKEWKNNKQSKDEEIEIVKSIKRQFKRFDFT